jgi:hypothetical protein
LAIVIPCAVLYINYVLYDDYMGALLRVCKAQGIWRESRGGVDRFTKGGNPEPSSPTDDLADLDLADLDLAQNSLLEGATHQ